jgi:succinate dehydrogenase / fumarate reductase cytochrome b subunit
MWLINSSIGKKVVMSVTGICLILFLTFHACMNAVAIFDGDAYNNVCGMLGDNWYAVVGTLGLAALAMFHFVFAIILTLENRKARGNNRYAVTDKPEKVEWASQNMFVLGLIVILGLLLHFYGFFYNMMFAELTKISTGAGVDPTNGTELMRMTFGNPVMAILYIIWFVAIWFHLSHGFWSSIQTLGINGKIWFNRWKVIGIIWVTIVMLVFIVVVLKFAFCGGCC